MTTPSSPWKTPLFDCAFDHNEIEAAVQVLQSGWLTMGELTQELENQFARFVGVKHAIAVSSGTGALHLALRSLNIGPGDEVICPSLTFVAAANTIVSVGARPVWADVIGEHDLTVSPEAIESKITPRTKAIEVMHYAGWPCQMDHILEVAARHGLPVIEDAAHAPGAEINGRRCGSLGAIGCFSFFSNKNLSTGEGGMVVTNDDRLAKKMRLMRSHGMTTLTLDRHLGRAYSYDVVELGYNYRLDELRAAIGLIQLEKLPGMNRKREILTQRYQYLLADQPGITIPFIRNPDRSCYHIFPILLEQGIDRVQFMTHLKTKGIQTSIHYPPIHQFSYYQRITGTEQMDLPYTEAAGNREVTLPLYPGMSEEQVTEICSVVSEFLRGQEICSGRGV